MMRTDELNRALAHLDAVRALLIQAGVSPTGRFVADTDALHQQLALFTEVSRLRAA
ncbi:MAG TPA: hypothetical protein VFH27_15700 [Longimicrobiaceae bacterium]|nr:hypothetical protein [Longimicrobiaceae bacterium]